MLLKVSRVNCLGGCHRRPRRKSPDSRLRARQMRSSAHREPSGANQGRSIERCERPGVPPFPVADPQLLANATGGGESDFASIGRDTRTLVFTRRCDQRLRRIERSGGGAGAVSKAGTRILPDVEIRVLRRIGKPATLTGNDWIFALRSAQRSPFRSPAPRRNTPQVFHSFPIRREHQFTAGRRPGCAIRVNAMFGRRGKRRA